MTIFNTLRPMAPVDTHRVQMVGGILFATVLCFLISRMHSSLIQIKRRTTICIKTKDSFLIVRHFLRRKVCSNISAQFQDTIIILHSAFLAICKTPFRVRHRLSRFSDATVPVFWDESNGFANGVSLPFETKPYCLFYLPRPPCGLSLRFRSILKYNL